MMSIPNELFPTTPPVEQEEREEVTFNGDEDVTTPEQRQRNAIIRAGVMMERFAHQQHALERSIALELQSMDYEQLDALEAHINALSETNCWWAEYEVRQIVMDEVERRRYKLQREKP